MRNLIFILFILASYLGFGQTLTNAPRIIYRANQTETVSVYFKPQTDSSFVFCKSSSEILDENTLISGIREHIVSLDSSDVVIAYGTTTIQYRIYKNGIDITPVPQADNTFDNIKQTAQSAVGVAIGSLTVAQVRALLMVLLFKENAIDANGRIKKLNSWIK